MVEVLIIYVMRLNKQKATSKRLKHQVDTVRATENVQRAQAAVAQRHSGSNSKLRTAMDSLERIKEKTRIKSSTIYCCAGISRRYIGKARCIVDLKKRGLFPMVSVVKLCLLV